MKKNFVWYVAGRVMLLLLLFGAAQIVSSLAALFCLNIPKLMGGGEFEADLLAGSASVMAWTIILSAVITIGVMFWVGWLDCRSLGMAGRSVRSVVWTVVWTIPLVVVVNLLLECFELVDLFEDVVIGMIHNGWGVFAIVIAGPVLEEFVFRLGIQGLLIGYRVRPWVAIVLTAFIFGVVHGNPAQIPGAMLMGVALGWLYWRSGTIWMSVAAHVCNNLFAVLLTLIVGADATLTGLFGGVLTSALVGVAGVVLLVLGWRLLNREFGR